MENVFNQLLERYEFFLLVFLRTSGIFLISPFFSSENLPNILKAGFSFILSLILALTLEIDTGIQDMFFFGLAIKEIIVGSIIGYISYAFFSTFYVMGQIVDMRIGFGMVNVIDPQHRVQVPIMGNFYYILAFLLLLITNGHHNIIRALIDSYKYIPVGSLTFNINDSFVLVDVMSKSFITGFKLSLPIVGIIFMIDLLLGILTRTIPQMNIFVVGLPLKILIGLILISFYLPMFYALTTGVLDNAIGDIYNFLKLHY